MSTGEFEAVTEFTVADIPIGIKSDYGRLHVRDLPAEDVVGEEWIKGVNVRLHELSSLKSRVEFGCKDCNQQPREE